jgi:hypothetical protein
VHATHQVVGLLGVRIDLPLEVADHRGRLDRNLTEPHAAGRPVDGDDVALVDLGAVRCGELLGLRVDLELLGAAHAGLAHPPGDDGRVRGLAAATGEHALGGDHPGEVVGVGLPADQHDLLSTVGPLDGGLGGEHGLAHGRAGRGVHALRQLRGVPAGHESREHQLGELVAGHPADRLVHVDEALVDQLGGDDERGPGGALAHAGLQHPELVALDGELDVAEVAVVRLQARHRRHQLVVGALVDVLEVRQRHGVADAGDDVLALRVLQIVAVDALRPAARVTGEGDSGAGVGAQVAEHHRADVDGGTGVAGDALAAAVDDRPLGVPRVEDGVDRHVHLLARVLREVLVGLLADDRLEPADDVLQVLGVQVEIEVRALLALHLVQGVLEELAVDVEHGLAEHLDQPAIGVPGEPLAAGLLRQPLHRLVVEADVEDGLHHPGHGGGGTGAHRHQQRVGRVAERLVHGLLQVGEVFADLGVQFGRGAAVLQVVPAGVGGDRETGRHGQSQIGHLGQVGALAAQQVLLVLIAFAEVVDPLRLRRLISSAGHR